MCENELVQRLDQACLVNCTYLVYTFLVLSCAHLFCVASNLDRTFLYMSVVIFLSLVEWWCS